MSFSFRRLLIIPALFFISPVFAQNVSKTWVSDLGNGRYKNPVLHSDYSDPDAIRVGDDYYLTASSFNCAPGLPILHSTDLVNWELVNYALKKQVPLTVFEKPQHGNGVWAPSMNYRNGEFYIYYPDPDFGVYMIKTKNPRSEWSEPVLVLPGKGIIDPTSFWDEDGKAYLAVGWAASRAGVNSLITVFRMNENGTKVLDEGRHVYDGHDLDKTVEGPKFYKRSGYYYLFAPAGGVATGWQIALRSKNIYGPYERRIVMDQGKSSVNGPHQGAWVHTSLGEAWFLHFQDAGAYGRILHLQPMIWKNDWPIIGEDADGDGKGEPVMEWKKPKTKTTSTVKTPSESDEFNGDRPGLQWQWHANPKVQWSALIPGTGFLRLFAYPVEGSSQSLWNVPNLLLQKFPAPDFTATAAIKWNVEFDTWEHKKAGLLVMGNDYAYLGISKRQQQYYLQYTECKQANKGNSEKVLEEIAVPNGAVHVRVRVSSPNAICQFSYSIDGERFIPIGPQFKAEQDTWIGAKLGLFCLTDQGTKKGSYLDIDWFRMEK